MPHFAPPSVLLVGINGYGATYVGAMLDMQAQGTVRIVGVADPMAARCPRLAELTALGASVFDSIEAFYAAGHRADLATIASPIQFHAPQSCAALAAGTAVLCEKPLGGCPADADRMAAAERDTGRFLAIGYQWSFSRAIQALKADVLNGRLGAPRRLKTCVLWPRGSHYYTRNNWAGRRQSADGRWILDSPLNNATAHYLHNMLYVLGDRVDTSARPVAVEAELYRANAIETFDTCAVRLRMAHGVEVLFYSTHATRQHSNPEFVFEFARGTVRYADKGQGSQIVGAFADGSTCFYGDPSAEPHGKLMASLAALREPGRGMVCGVAAARMQTLCAWALRDLPVTVFPEALLGRHTRENGDTILYVPGLAEQWLDAFEHDALPAERGAALAAPAVAAPLA